MLKQLDFIWVARGIIIIEICVASIITFHVFRDFKIQQIIYIFRRNSYIIKNFISSTRWLTAYFFMLASFQNLDIFMLSHLSTTMELANYSVAFKYYSSALLLLGSIHAVLLPMFSKVDMQDSIRQRQFVFKWLKTIGWIIIPIIIFDIFAKSFFIWINGVQYEKAFYIFIVFSVGVWLSLMFSPLVNILMSREAFRFLFVLGICALILNFTANYFLIPIWGGFGAAVATICSHGLINGSATLYIMIKR